MPKTTFTRIPSHAEWTKARDAAGGKSNLVMSVNVGGLIDKFAAAGGHLVKRQKPMADLRKGLEKYKADSSVKKIPDLVATIDSILSAITTTERADKASAASYKECEFSLGRVHRYSEDSAAFGNPAGDYRWLLMNVVSDVTAKLPAGAAKNNWTAAAKGLGDPDAVRDQRDSKKATELIAAGQGKMKAMVKKLVEDAAAIGVTLSLTG